VLFPSPEYVAFTDRYRSRSQRSAACSRSRRIGVVTRHRQRLRVHRRAVVDQVELIVPVGLEPPDKSAESFNVTDDGTNVTDFGLGVVTIVGEFLTTVKHSSLLSVWLPAL